MSTGTHEPARHGLTARLAALKAWREEIAQALAELRRWALVNELTDEQAATRIAHLERRLVTERLTVAFVGEASRGKSECINALFFADLGARLLPSGPGRRAQCATEILHDATQPPSIRLLPVETRESPRSLREFIGDPGSWTQVALDPSHPETLAPAFDALAQTQSVSAAQAHRLGLPADGGAQPEVPRWRYAIVNYPHPLLDLGITLLDMPGLGPLVMEPELTLQRLPDADAVVFVLSAESGVADADLAIWRDHVQPLEDQANARYLVLNKIDCVLDGSRSEAEARVALDRRTREAARALGVDHGLLHLLSARQGLAARLAGDAAALAASRLAAFEHSLAAGLFRSRHAASAAAVRAEARTLLAESRALLGSRRAFIEERVAELEALQGKNQKLVETLGRKSSSEHARLEETRTALAGLRAVHHRHAETLAGLLDPEAARRAGERARAALLASTFSAGLNEAIDAYFRDIRERLRGAVAAIGEVQAMMSTVNQRFTSTWGLAPVELTPFPTERFFLEIDRLEAHCRRDFRSASSLLTRGRQALAGLFIDTVVLKSVHVFEIADREARSWMGGFLRPLEAQVATIQDRARSRVEGVEKIRDAESGLSQRLGDLQGYLRECAQHLHEWTAHEQRLMRLLDAGTSSAISAPR